MVWVHVHCCGLRARVPSHRSAVQRTTGPCRTPLGCCRQLLALEVTPGRPRRMRERLSWQRGHRPQHSQEAPPWRPSSCWCPEVDFGTATPSARVTSDTASGPCPDRRCLRSFGTPQDTSPIRGSLRDGCARLRHHARRGSGVTRPPSGCTCSSGSRRCECIGGNSNAYHAQCEHDDPAGPEASASDPRV